MLSALILASTVALPLQSKSTPAPSDGVTLIETEAFRDLGGWVLDQQFMDLMGSPFLLAHGMGEPVADAATDVTIDGAGEHRVWVRTRDWVAPWGAEGAPGKFEVQIDGEALGTVFGTEGAAWHWQDGGTVELKASFRLGLHDLTGFEGRCDAVLFAEDLDWQPPADGEALETFRRGALGLPVEPVDRGEFDLVVVGGGVAGTCAAVTAARLGLTVALVQDRPVLGGNSSSEVRVWPEGHVNQMPYPRVGDVVMEVVPVRGQHSANAQAAPVFDDDRKLRVAKAEPNLTLFLECRMNGVEEAPGNGQAKKKRIGAIRAEHVRTAERIRIRGRLFADCTGDGSLGALAGADFEQTEKGHMGSSNLWNIQCLCEDEDPLSSQLAAACEDATFPRCPWAVDLTDKPFPGRDRGAKTPESGTNPISLGNWFWESGFDRDPITEMERVRDQNFRAMYGAWDAIKNVEGRYPAHRLNWVAYIAGKRESRRLLGDVILTGEDLRDGTEFTDGSFPCTWGIDTHHPHTKYEEGHDGDEFISDYTHGEGYVYDGPYWVPYRCLYSRNVTNLFMAGRDISTTHEALGAVRVMKTTGAMGEVVGMAASLCLSKDCTPRDIYGEHWDAMDSLLKIGAGKIERTAPLDNGHFLLEGAAARLTGKSLQYDNGHNSIGYWRTQGDYAEWAVDAGAGGLFELQLLASCVSKEAGGTAYVEIQDQYATLPIAIGDTGSWDTFKTQGAVKIKLETGQQRIRIKNGKESGPLMKLRAVRLRPMTPVEGLPPMEAKRGASIRGSVQIQGAIPTDETLEVLVEGYRAPRVWNSNPLAAALRLEALASRYREYQDVARVPIAEDGTFTAPRVQGADFVRLRVQGHYVLGKPLEFEVGTDADPHGGAVQLEGKVGAAATLAFELPMDTTDAERMELVHCRFEIDCFPRESSYGVTRRTFTPGPDGNATLRGLRPQSQTLDNAKDRVFDTSQADRNRGPFRLERSVKIELVPGARSRVAIPLVRSLFLIGHVVNPAGTPIEAARVQLTEQHKEEGRTRQSHRSCSTAADGSFRIRTSPGAPTSIGVSRSGYAPTSLNGDELQQALQAFRRTGKLTLIIDVEE